jgi:XTP/dITP diphosphohydrolase
MTQLLVATRNAHKVGEIRASLGGDYHYLTLTDFPAAPPAVEDAATFAGNAQIKSVGLAAWIANQPEGAGFKSCWNSLYVLADDSGLEVDALNGAPGVHSARFAALAAGTSGNSSDAENLAKLLGLLAGVPMKKRTARFRCVIALTSIPKPRGLTSGPGLKTSDWEARTKFFEGVCEGWLTDKPRGSGGFGYDPVFVPDGYAQTFAELGESIKNQFSHRARALAKCQDYLAHLSDRGTRLS